ncbi:hypothetical protein [Luteolibacter marinus]|uniref:hypothetical protein n=1 Tax=Luteolibacter marinus TaxID=2776705 RepID=UPI0018684892|nr:hypothetical protein [Luteolibacter marinus]
MDQPDDEQRDDVFSEQLEIDEGELHDANHERGKVLEISDQIRLLAKQNRLSLFKKRALRKANDNVGWLAEAELQFQSHAHPDCRFVQVMLGVTLDMSPGAKILAVQPDRAMVHQVKLTEALKPAFEATIPGIGLKTTLGAETASEQTFDQPVLTGYNGEDRAIWTFRIPAKGYELSLNLPLHLRMEYPSTIDILRARVQVSARVAVRGWADFIPLIGKKSGRGQTPIYLDR